MTKAELVILKKLAKHISKYDFHPTIIGEIMDVCASSTILIEEKNTFYISFEVNAVPTWAAVLTQRVIEFANKIGYEVDVYECYALIFDKHDNCIEVLYGDDAMHYYETGEMPEKKEKKAPKSIEDLKADLKILVDEEKFEKASKLRDKIHKMENRKNKTKC